MSSSPSTPKAPKPPAQAQLPTGPFPGAGAQLPQNPLGMGSPSTGMGAGPPDWAKGAWAMPWWGQQAPNTGAAMMQQQGMGGYPGQGQPMPSQPMPQQAPTPPMSQQMPQQGQMPGDRLWNQGGFMPNWFQGNTGMQPSGQAYDQWSNSLRSLFGSSGG